jgi:peptidoglycan hydrolase-like protein with peptidoglycan-binding domain
MTIGLATPEGIRSLQRALNYAIWYDEYRFIPITGVIDAETRRSIREFQRVFDFPITGGLTAEQVTALRQEMGRKNIPEP